MRSYYIRSTEKTLHAERRNPIFNQLDFLRPFVFAEKTSGDGKLRRKYQADSTVSCFEITIEDDGADAIDEVPPITENYAPANSTDDDGDKMFGMLIVGELRKMTPAAQKMFKRDVSKLLYT